MIALTTGDTAQLMLGVAALATVVVTVWQVRRKVTNNSPASSITGFVTYVVERLRACEERDREKDLHIEDLERKVFGAPRPNRPIPPAGPAGS